MPNGHLARLDLNLLVVLDALLAERSVSKAAVRLGSTQPAISRALGRLRAALDDALLVRSGHAMLATPRARALEGPLRAALRSVEAVVAQRPGFEPAHSDRTFRLATADYGVAVVLPRLMERLRREAPRVSVVVSGLDERINERLAAGTLDAVLAPRRSRTEKASSPGLVWSNLLEDEVVCVARAGHPEIGKTLSLRTFCTLPHVFVSPEGVTQGVVDEVLARRKLSRFVRVRLPAFLPALTLVSVTDCVLTVPRLVVEHFPGRAALRVDPVPVALPRLGVSLGWHEVMREDAGHAWFRGQVKEAVAKRGAR